MDEKIYWIWLSGIDDMWSKKMEVLFDYFTCASEIYEANENTLLSIVDDYEKAGKKGMFNEKDVKNILDKNKSRRTLEKNIRIMEKENIKITYKDSSDFPSRLKYLNIPVFALYYSGELPSGKNVAVIGARGCTDYGKKYATIVGENLSKGNINVISGMARGIDTHGMLGALKAGGKVYGVLGCGVNICYPAENMEMYEALKKRGGIISEFPPDSKPLAWHFPLRNRIISGLSDCICVIEARKKSGSLITVAYALGEGKEVFALPGRVDDALSVGCNELIRDGANIVFDGREIVFSLTGNEIKKVEKDIFKEMNLDDEQKKILGILTSRPQSIEEISRKSNIEITHIRSVLLGLDMLDLIAEVAKDYYVLN